MKAFVALLSLLWMPLLAYSQLPAKQTIAVDFPSSSSTSITVLTEDIIPFVPIEFTGTWPTGTDKLTFRILNTISDPTYSSISRQFDRVRGFDYQTGLALTTDEFNKFAPTPAPAGESIANKTIRVESNQQKENDFDDDKAVDGVVDLIGYYAFDSKVKDAGSTFTVLLPAPQLRRYYGIEIIAEGPAAADGSRKVVRTTTSGPAGEVPVPVVYAGNLEPLPHERFIPYSGIGAGFLKIKDNTGAAQQSPFLTTSIGLIITTRPVYTGLRNPYVHRYTGWKSWVPNRAFFSGGITTASLTYRGRALATSAVKGSLGAGLFLLPGLGLSYEFSFGGVANYNPVYDNRTKPFYMPGIMLRFTGQVTDIFKSNIGTSLATQPSK